MFLKLFEVKFPFFKEIKSYDKKKEEIFSGTDKHLKRFWENNKVDNYDKVIDKLKFLSSNKIEQINFDHIIPDKNNNWIDLADDNDFDNLSTYSSQALKDVILNRNIHFIHFHKLISLMTESLNQSKKYSIEI